MRGKRSKRIRRVPENRSRPTKERKTNPALWQFAGKFILAFALPLLLVSLIPEDFFGPLNRFSASMVGSVLRLLRLDPVVTGTYIRLDGFSVNVITECSAIHLVILYGAFITAFPTTRLKKWMGFGAGALLLFLVNALRISVVTLVGKFTPTLFDVSHVYFGQLGMMTSVLCLCLMWCRWTSDPGPLDGAVGFVLRFFLFSGLLFVLWVPLNRMYIGGIDAVIGFLFKLAGYRLVIPRSHDLYYQTFSLIVFGGLIMAVNGASFITRLRFMAAGFGVITIFQIAYRMCNVWIAAFQLQWITIVSQIIYNTCIYLLPLAMVLRFAAIARIHFERGVVKPAAAS